MTNWSISILGGTERGGHYRRAVDVIATRVGPQALEVRGREEPGRHAVGVLAAAEGEDEGRRAGLADAVDAGLGRASRREGDEVVGREEVVPLGRRLVLLVAHGVGPRDQIQVLRVVHRAYRPSGGCTGTFGRLAAK